MHYVFVLTTEPLYVTVIKCDKNIYQHMKNGGESYVRYHSSYCNHWKRL